MAWYVRAVERDLGLPSMRMNAAHLGACLNQMHRLLDHQIDFHRKNADRAHRIEHRLHSLGLIFLGLTVLSCGVHLLPGLPLGVHLPDGLAPMLTFLCGFLPSHAPHQENELLAMM